MLTNNNGDNNNNNVMIISSIVAGGGKRAIAAPSKILAHRKIYLQKFSSKNTKFCAANPP